MKNKILNMALAAAITPLLCCCTSNTTLIRTNPIHLIRPCCLQQ